MTKRPLGLKTTKAKKKSRPVPDDAAPPPAHQSSDPGNPGTPYTTVALPVSSAATAKDGNSAEDDGLTIDDLLELKSQAEEHLTNVRLLGSPESAAESGNLLRGICHECHRRIELAASSESVEEPAMSFLAWATLQLGLFLTPPGDEPLTALILPDEPDTLEGWCAISSRALASTKDADAFSGHFTMVQPTLNLVLALRDPNSQEVLARLQTWGIVVAEILSKPQLSISQQLSHISSALGLIEAVSPSWDDHVVESHGQSLFDELRTLLDTLASAVTSLPASEEPLDKIRVAVIRYLITRHVAQRALLHGSALAESIEDQYFPESEEETGAEDEFPIDTSHPEYQNTLIALNLAEKHFSTAIELIETDSLLEDMGEEAAEELKTQLSETLLTLGNMLEPGPKREAVYQRASAQLGNLEL